MNPDVKNILKSMRTSPDDKGKQVIEKAFVVAKKAHEGQLRASGEPYFNHVFATGMNLAEFGTDATTIAAGLLHDTIEDTDVTEEEILEQFGEEIVFLVNGVTKLGTLKYQGRKRHVESLRKFFVAVAKDIRVVAIKLADRLHNAETLEHIRPDKAKRIAIETIEIYAPLAYRLGMGRLVGRLEDAAFPFAYPDEYQMVMKLLKQKKKLNQKYLEKVWRNLQKEIATQNIPVVETHYRVKGIYSLWKKLQRKNMDIEKIYDIVALRVIVPTKEHCYLVLAAIHGVWIPLPNRIKDYIGLPKVNGYQSIHTTIFTGDGGIAEIQIRTPEMHEFAEYGFAAHHVYKQKGAGDERHSLAWLKELGDLKNLEGDEKTFLKTIKDDFFDNRIFVFTPHGDVLDLPKDSCVIDFAYAVHTEIGNTTQSAKINGKNSGLKTLLQSGDIVEIETNKSSHPTEKWMACVKTTLARKHIRNYLRDNHQSLWDKFFKK